MKRLGAMGFIAALVGLVLAVAAPCVHAGEMIDLNRATLEEIEALPISAEMAETIWRYREYRTFYKSVYDLIDLPGMTMEDFLQIKPLVKIE
ncbi:helix-hairpin-helix domain-containing protein, partial [bacterium]|nr:helix-hairpin-helix domain-containing protein [bacterium]